MLKKRLDYGFNGYQLPFVPRAPRSSRRRGPIQEKTVDNQLCAFDLLATVAGKLLEGENSRNTQIEDLQRGNAPFSNLIMEDQNEGNMFKTEHINKEAKNDTSSTLVSMITSSQCLETNETPLKMDTNNDKGDFISGSRKPEICVRSQLDSCIPISREVLLGNGYDMYSLEDPKFFKGKDTSSNCSIKLPLGMECCGLVSHCRGNNVNVVNRDDDDNSSECTQPSTIKATRLAARVNNQRIRKLLASKYWRFASKVKDGDLSQTELRCIYRCNRTGYKRQRSRRIYPFKKRKFYHYSSFSNSDGHRAIDQAGSVKHGVDCSSSCVAGKGMAFGSEKSHVKLRIKSFRVPELFIEIPETATVGFLKRRVMEAMTSLLGGELHVGVLLQGKKIRDDNTTLAQSGINCHDEKVESLGFVLEPSVLHDSTTTCSEDNILTRFEDPPQPISRCTTANVNLQGALDNHTATNVGNLVESDHDSTPSPTELTPEKVAVDYRALVAFPEGTPKALVVVPTLQKSKRSSDVAQRRIRRPFSVSEVEALVQAVEKLGTGRWRDVKLCAFENVKHRTYVDLKDKWKTLVHTARIAPQQRRGEPVPQELLDRVLSAHSYWSQQQAKQQIIPPDRCLL